MRRRGHVLPRGERLEPAFELSPPAPESTRGRESRELTRSRSRSAAASFSETVTRSGAAGDAPPRSSAAMSRIARSSASSAAELVGPEAPSVVGANPDPAPLEPRGRAGAPQASNADARVACRSYRRRDVRDVRVDVVVA